MIIDEFIEIKVPHKTVSYYRNKGYMCNVSDFIKIKPYDLPKSSEVRINVECENCKSINNISNNNYINKQLPKFGFYVCKNCSTIKRIKTNNEKYGVDFFSKKEDFKEIVEKKSIEKWGVSNYTKTEEYKIKTKETSNRKWGTDNYLQNNDNYNKYKETILLKYDVDNVSKINGVNIEKRKITNKKKYGVEHAMQNDDIFGKCFRKRKK